jgi:hypothetical protein
VMMASAPDTAAMWAGGEGASGSEQKQGGQQRDLHRDLGKVKCSSPEMPNCSPDDNKS